MTFLRRLTRPTNDEIQGMRQQKALMYAKISEHGTATVNCPYCLMGGVHSPVDVTKFIDNDGKREHTTTCPRGHTLRFKSIDEWRERRIIAGIQTG